MFCFHRHNHILASKPHSNICYSCTNEIPLNDIICICMHLYWYINFNRLLSHVSQHNSTWPNSSFVTKQFTKRSSSSRVWLRIMLVLVHHLYMKNWGGGISSKFSDYFIRKFDKDSKIVFFIATWSELVMWMFLKC